MHRFASFLVVIFALLGCTDETRKGYLELTGRIFVFNPRIAEANYVVTLSVLKQPPEGSRIEAEFDNPAGGTRLLVKQMVRPSQLKIALESEALQCIRKDRRYAFKVTLLDAEGRSLQVVESSIASTLDQSVLPDAPLVEGPGYAPSPALQQNGSARVLKQIAMNCPA